jgi:hypothetical protein
MAHVLSILSLALRQWYRIARVRAVLITGAHPLPPVGNRLDRQDLEDSPTIPFHVVVVKRPNA